MKIATKSLHWFYRLSWKKAIGISMFLLVVGVVPISLRVVNSPTRTDSQAALINPSPEAITKEFEVPVGPPKIYLVDHFFGKVGDAVLIHGENLGGLHEKSSVSLAGQLIEEENLVTWTGSYIEFKVPTEAKSGQVEVNILGEKTMWPGMFFVTDENTEAELRLEGEVGSNQAQLLASNIDGGRELLVWLLIINNDGELSLDPLNGVKMTQKIHDFSVGKVYEIVIDLNSQVTLESLQQPTPLLSVTKTEGQVVGIARGELSDSKGAIKPLQSHPLYVSF